MNSDASDFVLPNPAQQARCMNIALGRAGLNAEDIDLVSTHATATGDIQVCGAAAGVQ
jgi:3-oxoacyl-[acyl-carrier-protein] synthase II